MSKAAIEIVQADITTLQLLEMRSGLRFVEDYVDGEVSHCIAMLFGEGAHDHAAYAAALPLDHEPGTVWNYSSGTTNIVTRILGDIVGGEGPVHKSGKGDLYVYLDDATLLTKALRPLPEKWHGLQDTELRYRQRYWVDRTLLGAVEQDGVVWISYYSSHEEKTCIYLASVGLARTEG